MKVLVLNGNSERNSLTAGICEAYANGAKLAGHTVQLMQIGEMKFDPVLHEGYHTEQPPEPDLKSFQEKILWADHFVIAYPTWWGGMPALLKGLFDRALYSGFAYKYHEKDPLWDKLLKGRSATIITTMDAPLVWYALAYWSAGTHMLKNAVLKFCGFKPVDTLYITRVRFKTKDQLQKELDKVQAKATRLRDKR